MFEFFEHMKVGSEAFRAPCGQDLGYSAGMSWGICCCQATEFQRGGAQMDPNFQSSLPKLPSEAMEP